MDIRQILIGGKYRVFFDLEDSYTYDPESPIVKGLNGKVVTAENKCLADWLCDGIYVSLGDDVVFEDLGEEADMVTILDGKRVIELFPWELVEPVGEGE